MTDTNDRPLTETCPTMRRWVECASDRDHARAIIAAAPLGHVADLLGDIDPDGEWADWDVIARKSTSVSFGGIEPGTLAPHLSLREEDATGIAGQLAGEGFTHIIVDDPHKNRAEAESMVIREGACGWAPLRG